MNLFKKKENPKYLAKRTDITWELLGQVNKERQKQWTGSKASADLSFIGLEIGEEAGEVQGALKKLIRERKGIAGNKVPETVLMENLQGEIGDLAINISRLANELDISVDSCIRKAFNNKSIEMGIDITL